MSYRDVLARSERLRPDGRPVWPLTNKDWPSLLTPRGIETRQGGDALAAPSRSDESPSRKGAPNTMRGAL